MNPALDVLKIAALAAGGALATTALRRVPARLRHDVWLLVVVGALLVPVVELALPPLYFAASTSWESLTEPSARWISLAIVLWLTGAAIALARLLLGVVELRRIATRATPLENGAAAAALAAASARAGCRRHVGLLLSPDVAVPATWGVWRPVVVLPTGAEQWPAERLRLVLLHELLHVRRQDAVIEFLLRVVEALYWFHPAVWLAARRVRLERERACDEAVLQAGARASDYCEHLVEIMRAAAHRPAGAVVGAAMATPSTLEYRVRALLDRPCARRRAWLGAPVLLLGALAIYGVAVVAPCTAAAEASHSVPSAMRQT